ncbi:MAG: DUF6515 family protein [Gammaproteobacteria bacterium]
MNIIKNILLGCCLIAFNSPLVSADDRRHYSPRDPSGYRHPAPPGHQRHPAPPMIKHYPTPHYDHYYKPGYKIRHLPRGYSRVIIDRGPYYFYDGYFYQPYHDSYLVIDAPIGAIVLSLPRLHHQFHWHGIEYYVSGPTYYRRHPQGYIVVPKPKDYRRW